MWGGMDRYADGNGSRHHHGNAITEATAKAIRKRIVKAGGKIDCVLFPSRVGSAL
jgi:hypothetical protein